MSDTEVYEPPFQWFGGKSRVAGEVWARLGCVDSYVEPFFGSGAALMLRPAAHGEQRETVNDYDGFVANFWRAVKLHPEAVAEAADWPINENDLTARHIWLVRQFGGGGAGLRDRLEGDPDWCDPKVAGWWCWGLCGWIGGGWCSGGGPWTSDGGLLTRVEDSSGVRRVRPHLSDDGRGVNRQRPHLGDDGRGVNRKRPGGGGGCAAYSQHVRDQIQRLSDRLRRVRVCCGDWSRVVTPTAAGYCPTDSSSVGIFLDPPYSAEANRDMGCYATDCGRLAHDVREWCAANGNDKRLRIALCGYDGEHNDLERAGWSVFAWSATGGMSSIGKSDTAGKVNKHRERIWFSPACLPQAADSLFGGGA